MLPAIQNLIQRFEQVESALPLLIGELLEENSHRIEDLQTQQLEAGIDSEGNPIEPSYSPFTVQIKRLKGQPSDRVTLKDTGAFHKGMFLAGSKGNYQIGNRDEKLPKLERKYGKEILGLTDDSKQEIIDDVLRPELPDRIRQKLLT